MVLTWNNCFHKIFSLIFSRKKELFWGLMSLCKDGYAMKKTRCCFECICFRDFCFNQKVFSFICCFCLRCKMLLRLLIAVSCINCRDTVKRRNKKYYYSSTQNLANCRHSPQKLFIRFLQNLKYCLDMHSLA